MGDGTKFKANVGSVYTDTDISCFKFDADYQ